LALPVIGSDRLIEYDFLIVFYCELTVEPTKSAEKQLPRSRTRRKKQPYKVSNAGLGGINLGF